MSKHTSQRFQLKPKHLVTAVLGISLLAIAALVIGVIGTLKPRNTEARAQAEQEQKPASDANRVEVWKPVGANQQGAIVLNPNAVNQPQPAGTANEDTEAAMSNPFTAPRADSSEQVRRARPRPQESARPRAEAAEPAKPAATQAAVPVESAPAAPVRPQPAEPKPEPKPEPKSEPKPEPKPEPKVERRAEPKPPAESRPAPAPKPAAKPQPKEVIDNLF